MNVDFKNGLRIAGKFALKKFYAIVKQALQNRLNTTSYLVVRRQCVKQDDLTPTCNTSNSEPTNSAACCLQSSDVPSSAVPPSAPDNTDVPSSAPNNSTLLECVGNGDIQNVFNNSRHPLDADHKNNQESLIEESTQNKLKTKICIHYKRNQCKHGLKGKHCPFLHPERCQKLMQNGTKSPDGCNLGKNVLSSTPKCALPLSQREFALMISAH